jgi:cold shock protein
MPVGTVKFFNDSKGYGFIAPDDGGQDAFVHITAVERAGLRTLTQNQKVSFDLEQDQRGKTKAVNLQAVEGERNQRRARKRPALFKWRSPPSLNSTARERSNAAPRPMPRRSTMCVIAASAPRMPGSEWPTASRAPKPCAGRKRRPSAYSEERNAA